MKELMSAQDARILTDGGLTIEQIEDSIARKIEDTANRGYSTVEIKLTEEVPYEIRQKLSDLGYQYSMGYLSEESSGIYLRVSW